jgi:hypothetical protein
MQNIGRRRVVAGLALGACLPASAADPIGSDAAGSWSASPSDWLEKARTNKAFESQLLLGRFLEPMYWLAAPLKWSVSSPAPGASSSANVAKTEIIVPTGFVTDLASIPPEFFSLLRPDGQYAAAAIVHDWLYWNQSTTKDYADNCLRQGMVDLEVDPFQIGVIFGGVHYFGASAWAGNAALRKAGERRVLTKFPNTPMVKWADWKNDPGNFGAL